jgi:hypothetical protein
MRMPSLRDTQIKFLFEDSVLRTADKTLIKFLPTSIERRVFLYEDTLLASDDTTIIKSLPQSFNTIHFKILEQDVIDSLIKAYKHRMKTPNYLRFKIAEKTDSGYFVVLSSLSGIDYGAGGTMGLELSTKGDSIRIQHKGFSSIN